MRRTYSTAMDIAKEFIERFVRGDHQIAGSLRRKEETVGDIDLVVSESLEDISKRIETNHYAKRVNGGLKKMDIDYKSMRFNLYRAEPKYWGSMLFFLTGPAGYTIAYRRIAKSKGLKLDQYGLWKGERRIAGGSETSIYKAFGKEYKAPEHRGN